jgi:hypothetical protein
LSDFGWGYGLWTLKNSNNLQFPWRTYRATVERNGEFTSQKYKDINFNEDLATPIYPRINIVWERVFRYVKLGVIAWDKVFRNVKLGVIVWDKIFRYVKLGVIMWDKVFRYVKLGVIIWEKVFSI